MYRFNLIMCVLLSMPFALPADASYVYNFEAITANSVWRNDPGLAVNMEILDLGLNKVAFKFQNESTITGVVAQIYFEQGPLKSIASFDWGSQSKVNFAGGANPSNLPGANNATPSFQAKFSAGANSPAPKNGLSSGEWLTINFNLTSGQTFSDVISALEAGIFRVGTHITSLPDGKSDAFINNKEHEPINVPEPATITLLALSAFGIMKNRRK